MIRALIFDYYGVIRPDGFRWPGKKNDAALLEFIASLKGRYKIGLLSNSEAGRFPELFESYNVHDYFDATLASGEVAYAKPDKEIFQLMAERLGVKPGECIMIDDREDHCIGARTAGMQAIQYQGLDRLKAEMPNLLADAQ